MSPEEKRQFEQMKVDIETIKRDMSIGDFPDKKVFDKAVLVNNGLKLINGSFIYGGSATTNASIKLDVGTPPAGSIYISTNGVGEVWVMQTTTWTKVTIP